MIGITTLRVALPFLRGIRSLRNLPNRPYGSAAAAVYDYEDYDDEYDHDSYRSVPFHMEDSLGSEPERGVHWVMIGEPGARRHFYARRLSELLQVPHISMGILVRQELNPRSALYEQIANLLNEGKLVPEEIVFSLLSKRLEEGYSRGETGFILDGIPRTKIQAEILDQIAPVDLVINFKCTEENALTKEVPANVSSHKYLRLSGSGYGSDQHLHGEQLMSPAAHATSSWKDNTNPLEDYYRKQRKLLDFEVSGVPGEAWQGLLAALHLQHVNADTSQKLTA